MSKNFKSVGGDTRHPRANVMAEYDDYEDAYDEGCLHCGWPDVEPDAWESACFDDLCHGGEVPCMHGDYARLRCTYCGH